MSRSGYEFKIIEWVPKDRPTSSLTAHLNEYGAEGWQLAHIHEVGREVEGEFRVVLLIYMQREVYTQ